MWFDQLRFGSKLALNFVVGSGTLLLALVFAAIQIGTIHTQLGVIKENSVASLRSASLISQLRLRYRVRSLELMLAESDAERDKLSRSMNELDGQLKDEIATQRKLIDDDQDKPFVDAVEKSSAAYRDSVEKAVALLKTGDRAGAVTLQKSEWVKLANATRDATDALEKFKQGEARERTDQAYASGAAARTSAWLALLISSVIALGFSIWFARRISQRLSAAVSATQRIAEGDLNAQLGAPSKDEIGTLNAAMLQMRDSLRKAVSDTRQQAHAVSEAAKLLSGNVGDMEHNSHAQSAAASAIAANVEELTTSIAQVSDNTAEASTLAADADRQAATGASSISRVVDEIRRLAEVVNASASHISALEEQSARISNIVVVIREIADQTNLLALNAAIEAARAGEQGRGFAVVADEVRKLAERTSHSTAEISQMIGTIQVSTREAVSGIRDGVSSVDQGVALAQSAGEAIKELRGIASHVSDLVSGIAEGLREQSAASNDVAGKVEQIARRAEEISHNSGSTSNASQQLNHIANEMLGTINHFRL
ncbi:methyl-accepting chemotaxis protein [Uliginosibacterium sediminicola]|uniref:Methyl-accepting chemotaxis protein n=1 Tax=Uliginosibacterium sediminicola TaxID=2024550 RepID=A0ABU9Z256_9RHOO